MKASFPGFDACMQMMRKQDPGTQEDGFHWLLPHAHEYVKQLVEAFTHEKDHGLRCWLLDLIGGAKSPQTLTLMVECVRGDDAELRTWAIWGLKHLDTRDAGSVLHEARSYAFATEEETAIFRDNLEYILNYQLSGTGDLSPVPPELGARGPSCL